jgi:hypothetical protein
MSAPRTPTSERRLELLCDRALAGLDAAEAAELDRLLAEAGEVDPLDLDLAAAAIDLGAFDEPLEPLPASLRARIEASAAEHLPARASVPIAPTPPLAEVIPLAPRRADRTRWLGWMVAAACFLLALGLWLTRSAPPPRADLPPPVLSALAPPRPPTPAEQRAALLAGARDVVKIDWSATRDPLAQGASGDVVWSNAEQRGYMRFHGLSPNDRRAAQFQLWIFDAAQDQRYPVDGGVFDVDPTTGDVIVPIHAKLKVMTPTLFAVTVEKPGGVVVSGREHIVLTAAVSS